VGRGANGGTRVLAQGAQAAGGRLAPVQALPGDGDERHRDERGLARLWTSQEAQVALGVLPDTGTSAGAAAMSETMLVKGTSGETHRIGDLHMSPGLGLIRDVIIDQHFAERGRFGRLLGAVAHNPRVLGLGIDEDTAAVVDGDQLQVIGSGAVYVVDGQDVTHSNVAEARPERVLSMHDVRVHVLGTGDGFDLHTRQPVPAKNG